MGWLVRARRPPSFKIGVSLQAMEFSAHRPLHVRDMAAYDFG